MFRRTLLTISWGFIIIAVLAQGTVGPQPVLAALHHAPVQAQLPGNVRLTASPPMADVGGNIQFTLTARAWPQGTNVTLSFVSRHHGFTGKMDWVGSCTCFRLAVSLAPRAHKLERAKATATIHVGKAAEKATTSFLIRGLAANGHGFAPGGPQQLTGWVSDPTPVQGEYEHYCAWVRTADGLGVSGVHVRFIAHLPSGTRSWNGGTTGTTGVVCSHKSIGKAKAGTPVRVDIYVGSMHAQSSFTPRP